jgi:hypothetical protein
VHEFLTIAKPGWLTSGAKSFGEVVSMIAASGSGFHVAAGLLGPTWWLGPTSILDVTGGRGAGGLVALWDGETGMLEAMGGATTVEIEATGWIAEDGTIGGLEDTGAIDVRAAVTQKVSVTVTSTQVSWACATSASSNMITEVTMLTVLAMDRIL